MKIHDIELDDVLVEADWLADIFPHGSEPRLCGYGPYEYWDLVSFTAGPLADHVAATDGKTTRLLARSRDELVPLLTLPANLEWDELYEETTSRPFDDSFVDAFADGTRTPDDLRRAAELEALRSVALEHVQDEWDAPYVNLVMFATKLGCDSPERARELQESDDRWVADAAREYLTDLRHWQEQR